MLDNPKNRLLIAFFLFVTMVIVGSVQFLESQFVAKKIRYEISKRIPSNLMLDFNHIEFGYIPPRITFNNVEVKFNDKNIGVDGRADAVSLEYSPIDIIVGRPVISNLEISSAEIYIEKSEKSTGAQFDLQNIFDDYKKIVSELPVYLKRMTLKNNVILASNDQIYIEKVQTVLLPSSIFLNLEIGGGISNAIFGKDFFDSISLDAQMSDSGVVIRKLKVLKELETISISGSTSGLRDLKSFTGILSFDAGIKETSRLVQDITNKKLPDLNGYAKGEISIVNGEIVKASFQAHDIVTEFARAEMLNVAIDISDNILSISKLSATMPLGGQINLLNVAKINIEEDDFTSNKIQLELNNAHSNDFLYVTRDSLEVLKTRMTGQASIEFGKGVISVLTDSTLKGENLVLMSKKNEKILTFNKYELEKTMFKIQRSEAGGVFLEGEGKIGGGNIQFKGEIKKEHIDISAEGKGIDFDSLGQISTAQISGRADLNIKVKKDEQVEQIQVALLAKDSVVYGYGLGEIDANLILDLKQDVLLLPKISGNSFQTQFSGSSSFELVKNGSMLINIDHISGTRNGIENIFAPIAKNISIPEDLGFVYDGKVKVYKEKGNDITVRSDLNIKNINYLNEVFENGKLEAYYKEDILKVERFNIKKSRSIILGNFLINTKTGFYELDIAGNSIPLNSFTNYSILNLGLKCQFNFELYASGTSLENNLRFQSRLDQCLAGVRPVENSVFTFYKSREGFIGTGRFLGDDVQMKFTFEKELSPFPRGEISFHFNIEELQNHLCVLSEHNSRNSDLNGKLIGDLKFIFDGKNWNTTSILGTLKEFSLNNRGKVLRTARQQVVEVKNGKINSEDFEISGESGRIQGHVSGDLTSKFSVSWKANLDANFLELLTSEIESATGVINLNGGFEKNNIDVDSYYRLSSNSFSLKLKNIPVPFTEISTSASLLNNVFIIDELSAGMGKGKISGKGRIILKLPFPVFDVDVIAKQVSIPIHYKSTMFANSDVKLTGSRPPYDLKGFIDVYYASIEDELSDIPMLKSFEGDYSDLIPKVRGGRNVDPISLDLKVTVGNNFRIRNSLMDLILGGNANVRGPLSRPSYNVQFDMLPQRSKVILKGHEFLISKGRLLAKDDGFERLVDVDVDAFGSVQNYELRLLASGEVSRLRIDLSSNPSLSQEDIVSLLTLGVTSDVSKALSDKERTSITTMGVGSLLFDQLKINQNLNSSMGLKLSLQPEFKKQDDNLFQSRRDTGSDAGAGYRSTTKLRVQKQISPKMDMSLSSSLGSNTDQSQEMNVNYQLNKDLSLEGIYEIKSDEQNENIDQESIGADIKYKWSF
ncbi:MAG: hypothetical protein Fur0010_02470 [Bdellovibrio sp.]